MTDTARKDTARKDTVRQDAARKDAAHQDTARQDTNSRAGLVALLGPSNAGKSLLLNALVGNSVSIVSHKRQTTRFAVRGVWTRGTTQAVFVDVPGFLKRPRRLLERHMQSAATAALSECNLALLVIDSERGLRAEERLSMQMLRECPHVILVLNKIDLIAKESLLGLAAEMSSQMDFRAVCMVSAKNGSGLNGLRDRIESELPSAPWLLTEDKAANHPPDSPDPIACAEITRGIIYSRLHQELPYAIAVETTESERKGKILLISQTIHVERDSQKGIVIGAGGQMLGNLRKLSESNLSLLTGMPVRLRLHVRVSPGWAESTESLEKLLPSPNLKQNPK
ncbi:MAG: GTPase Era [Alphaproteobacteria bacterium]